MTVQFLQVYFLTKNNEEKNRDHGNRLVSAGVLFYQGTVWTSLTVHVQNVASSKGSLPKLFKLCPLDKINQGSQFYIELYKENFKQLLILNR